MLILGDRCSALPIGPNGQAPILPFRAVRGDKEVVRPAPPAQIDDAVRQQTLKPSSLIERALARRVHSAFPWKRTRGRPSGKQGEHMKRHLEIEAVMTAAVIGMLHGGPAHSRRRRFDAPPFRVNSRRPTYRVIAARCGTPGVRERPSTSNREPRWRPGWVIKNRDPVRGREDRSPRCAAAPSCWSRATADCAAELRAAGGDSRSTRSELLKTSSGRKAKCQRGPIGHPAPHRAGGDSERAV